METDRSVERTSTDRKEQLQNSSRREAPPVKRTHTQFLTAYLRGIVTERASLLRAQSHGYGGASFRRSPDPAHTRCWAVRSTGHTNSRCVARPRRDEVEHSDPRRCWWKHEERVRIFAERHSCRWRRKLVGRSFFGRGPREEHVGKETDFISSVQSLVPIHSCA